MPSCGCRASGLLLLSTHVLGSALRARHGDDPWASPPQAGPPSMGLAMSHVDSEMGAAFTLSMQNAAEHLSRLSLEDHRVVVTGWLGQLGDDLLQVTNALLIAEAAGMSQARVPAVNSNGLWDLFNMPPGATFEIRLPERTTCWCDVRTYFYCESTELQLPLHRQHQCFQPTERRYAFEKYLRPLLKPTHDPFAVDKELIIDLHGDVPAAFQPPCAIYHKVIGIGRNESWLRRVRIVTEPVRSNPCIEEIVQRHSATIPVVVQGQSAAEDAAALLFAEYMVPALSTFGMMMAYGNGRLRRVFAANHTRWDHPFPCGAPVERSTVLNVPGLQDLHQMTLDDRLGWMKRLPEDQVSVAEECSM